MLRHPDPYHGPTVRGIDVSFWQGPSIDWAKVAASGVRYAFCRASQGHHEDKTFARNYRLARQQGVHPGATAYVKCTQDVLAQADFFASLVEPMQKAGDMRPMIDVEKPGNEALPATQIADSMLAWLDRVKTRLGVDGIVYAGAGFFESFVHDHRLAAFPLYTPWYSAAPCMVPNTWPTWTFWQYTDAEHVPGIGHCDGSVFRGDEAALAVFRGVVP